MNRNHATVVSLVGAVGLLSLASWVGHTDHTGPATPVVKPAIEAKAPITAEELDAAYSANEAGASTAYNNRVFSVVGTVEKVYVVKGSNELSGVDDRTAVKLYGGVTAYIDKLASESDMEAVAALGGGDKVLLLCHGSHYFYGATMADGCTVAQ
jgi:membrane peptidoglycan carboxypeptidase